MAKSDFEEMRDQMIEENEKKVDVDEEEKPVNYQLLDCPFCGGRPVYRKAKVLVVRGGIPEDRHFLDCRECGIKTRGFKSRAGVEKYWNQRGE